MSGPVRPIEERFWAHVKKRPADECWEWLRHKDKNGYGVIKIDGRDLKSHRVSYSLYYGQIPNGLCVLHACDNPSCVRPDHLFLGTKADNMLDKKNKGRCSSMFGESNPSAKLTSSKVANIREMVASGLTQVFVAHLFNISFQHVSDICRYTKWARVGRAQ